jgi:DNA-binding MarR family transcriptional regulator
LRIAFRLNRIFAFAAQSVPDSLAENFMSMLSKVTMAGETGFLSHYLESLSLVERLHRLLLDVIKDEFERLGSLEINAVQALLLFNIGENEVTAGELKSRGYYQGSNVSYNLKKLVDMGYMHHQRSELDRRSVRVRLTEKGDAVRRAVGALIERHADGLEKRGILDEAGILAVNGSLKRLERYWAEQIRYIY